MRRDIGRIEEASFTGKGVDEKARRETARDKRFPVHQAPRVAVFSNANLHAKDDEHKRIGHRGGKANAEPEFIPHGVTSAVYIYLILCNSNVEAESLQDNQYRGRAA